MILYIENPKDSTQKLLELVNEFRKVAGYINIRYQLYIFKPTMKYQKRNVKKMKYFKIAAPKIKYLGVNLTKEVKDLYAENYTTLIKKTEDDSKKLKHIPWSCVGINIVKMAKADPKQSTDVTQSLSNYP